MSKLKVKGISSKIFLALLILAGAASFFIFPTLPIVQWLVVVISFVSVLLLLLDYSPEFVFIVTNFITVYAIYGVLFTYGFPLWVVILAVAMLSAVCSIIIPSVISNENKLLYAVYYALVISEIYLALSFWLVNPLARSLIVAVFAYLFVGFNKSQIKEHFDKKNFLTYLYVSLFSILLMLSTVTWGH